MNHEDEARCPPWIFGDPSDPRFPIARFQREVMKVEGVPAEFVIPFLLGALSIAGARGLEVESFRGKFSRPNLFIFLEAESGVGKSEIGKRVFQPHFDHEFQKRGFFHENELPLLKAKLQKLQAQLRRSEKHDTLGENELADILKQQQNLEKQLLGPRHVVEDCTQEALEQVISQQDGIVSLISTDARKVVKNILGRHRNGNSEEDVFLKAWSGDPFSVDRITRPSILPVRDTCLSMFLALQPDLFQQLIRRDFVESGFLPRLLLVRDSGSFNSSCSAEGFDSTIESDYLNGMGDVIDFYRSQTRPFQFAMSPQARTTLEAFRQEAEHRASLEPALAGCYRRWAEQACRISVCLQIARLGPSAHNTPLLYRCATDAVVLMRWFGHQQRDLLIGITEEETQILTEKLNSLVHQNPKGISIRNIYKKLGITKAKAESLIKSVENLHIQSVKTGGRPSEIVMMKNATPGL